MADFAKDVRSGGDRNERLRKRERELERVSASERLLESPAVKDYAGQWVAALNGQVIASDQDLDGLRVQLWKRPQDLPATTIRFIEVGGTKSRG